MNNRIYPFIDDYDFDKIFTQEAFEQDPVRYENSVNAYRDYLATIDYAAKKGIEEGFEEGVQKGIEEGIEKGLQKWEQKKALEIARNLKSMGMTPEQIMNITHLSLAEIDSL